MLHKCNFAATYLQRHAKCYCGHKQLLGRKNAYPLAFMVTQTVQVSNNIKLDVGTCRIIKRPWLFILSHLHQAHINHASCDVESSQKQRAHAATQQRACLQSRRARKSVLKPTCTCTTECQAVSCLSFGCKSQHRSRCQHTCWAALVVTAVLASLATLLKESIRLVAFIVRPLRLGLLSFFSLLRADASQRAGPASRLRNRMYIVSQ